MSLDPKPFKFRPGDLVVAKSSTRGLVTLVVVTGYLRNSSEKLEIENWYKLIERGGGEFIEAPEAVLVSMEEIVARRLMGEQ